MRIGIGRSALIIGLLFSSVLRAWTACTVESTGLKLHLPNYGDSGDTWATCIRNDLDWLNDNAVSTTTGVMAYLLVLNTGTILGNGFSVGVSTFMIQGGNVGISSSTPRSLFVVGNNLFRVTSGGNVGVGEHANEGKLDVVGNLITKDTAGGTDYTIRAMGGGTKLVYIGDNTVGNPMLDGLNGNTAATPAYGYFNNAGLGTFRANTNILAFATNSSTRVVIDANGNVGIGVNPPSNALLTLGGSPTIAPDTADASDSKIMTLSGGGTAASSRGARLQLSGNEASGSGRLDLFAGSTGQIRLLVNDDNDVAITIKGDDGNVGIGSTSPSKELDVTGEIKASNYYNIGSQQGVNSPTCSGAQFLQGIKVSSGIVTAAGTCGTAGAGDAVLASTQTFAGTNTFGLVVFSPEMHITSCTAAGLTDSGTNTTFGAGVVGSTLTITTTGGSVMVCANIGAETTGTGFSSGFLQDGKFVDNNTSTIGPGYTIVVLSNQVQGSNWCYITKSPTAAVHSYTLVMRNQGAGTWTMDASLVPSRFCVGELK